MAEVVAVTYEPISDWSAKEAARAAKWFAEAFAVPGHLVHPSLPHGWIVRECPVHGIAEEDGDYCRVAVGGGENCGERLGDPFEVVRGSQLSDTETSSREPDSPPSGPTG